MVMRNHMLLLEAEIQELQINVTKLSTENIKLKQQAVDASWKISHKEVTLTKQQLGAWGRGVGELYGLVSLEVKRLLSSKCMK